MRAAVVRTDHRPDVRGQLARPCDQPPCECVNNTVTACLFYSYLDSLIESYLEFLIAYDGVVTRALRYGPTI